jgi:hypothetical protein
MAIPTLALTLAACASGTITPAAHHASPSPTVNATAAAISAAVSKACGEFQVINSQIEANTASDHTVGDLMSTVQADSITWDHGLSRAMSAAGARGVPMGGNAARVLAVKISQAASAAGLLGLDVAVGKAKAVRSDWLAVTNALNDVQMKCP